MQTFINEEMIYAAMKAVIDPELGLNIVDLGLIYSVEIGKGDHCGLSAGHITVGDHGYTFGGRNAAHLKFGPGFTA